MGCDSLRISIDLMKKLVPRSVAYHSQTIAGTRGEIEFYDDVKYSSRKNV